MKFQLPALPFTPDSLEPFLSRRTIEVHYFGHHKSYVDKLNDLTMEMAPNPGSLERIIQNYDGQLYNNAAQAWNHTFYWHGLCAEGRSDVPEDNGDFDKAVDRSFGGWHSLEAKLRESAAGIFGSGYIWLTVDGRDHLEVLTTQNAGNPLRFDRVRPIWNFDLWEHAYYLDYQNVRSRYVDGLWDHINWDFVETNFLQGTIPNMSKFMVPSAKLEVAIGQHSAPVFD